MSIYIDEFETLYGISENVEDLRKRILDIAFTGQLINSNNEKHGKKLVKSIRNKRKEMIENKVIRKPRGGVDLIDPLEAPHDIPKNWVWDKIGYLFNIYNGDSIKKSLKDRKYKKIEKGYDYLETKDVGYYGELNYDTGIKVPFEEEGDFSIAPPNRPLICWVGGSAGKKIGFTQKSISFDSTLFAVESFDEFNYKFLFYYYQSNTFFKQFSSKLKGIIGGVSMGRFREIYIPVPPLEEQQQIVEKIEFLMKEVDALEEKLKEKENISEKLSKAVVEQINESKNAEELEDNLRFIIENFDVIFQTPKSMDELRNVVLQLAIEGKLVKQDENDEPASELIKRIEEEKKGLIKEGKIKKSRIKIRLIEEDEIPFEIPDSWRFITSKDMCNKINYGYTAKAIERNTGTKMLRITDIQDGKVNWSSVPYCEIEKNKIAGYVLNENDIVIARTGGTVGKSFIAKGVDVQAVYASYLIRMLPSNEINPDYFYYYLQSPYYWKQITDGVRGGAQPNVNATTLGNLIIPLPPLNEQKRIVEKVDLVMKIIDKMEEELEKKYEIVEKLGSV